MERGQSAIESAMINLPLCESVNYLMSVGDKVADLNIINHLNINLYPPEVSNDTRSTYHGFPVIPRAVSAAFMAK